VSAPNFSFWASGKPLKLFLLPAFPLVAASVLCLVFSLYFGADIFVSSPFTPLSFFPALTFLYSPLGFFFPPLTQPLFRADLFHFFIPACAFLLCRSAPFSFFRDDPLDVFLPLALVRPGRFPSLINSCVPPTSFPLPLEMFTVTPLATRATL